MPQLFKVDAQAVEDACRDALSLARQPLQEVLSADSPVAEAANLVDGQRQHPAGTGHELDLASGRRRAAPDVVRNCVPDCFEVDVATAEEPPRRAFVFSEQSEEEVFGADVVVAEAVCPVAPPGGMTSKSW